MVRTADPDPPAGFAHRRSGFAGGEGPDPGGRSVGAQGLVGANVERTTRRSRRRLRTPDVSRSMRGGADRRRVPGRPPCRPGRPPPRSARRRAASSARPRGAAAQGGRGEEDMDGQVEGEPVPQQEGAVQQQETTGRELDVGAAGGAVGDRIPQVGQDPAGPARFQGTEDLPPQGAGVEPAVVVGVDVLAAVLQAQGGGAHEALGAHDQGGAAAHPQCLRDAFGQVTRAGGRGAVEGDARPRTAVARTQVEQTIGEPLAEPVPGDRFQSHTAMMRQPAARRRGPGARASYVREGRRWSRTRATASGPAPPASMISALTSLPTVT
jgi:hypothetical protein